MSFLIFFIIIGLIALVLGLIRCRRNQAIKRMSLSIRRVMAGDDSIDLREYRNGELAALAADVQKLTLSLREKDLQLSKDKTILLKAISDISHQLKTPLASLSMYLELLSRPTLDEAERLKFSQSAERQITRLAWLIQSLLLMSKLDAKAIAFKIEKCNLREILEETAETLLPKISEKAQIIQLSCEPDTYIMSDRNWLVEALSNLLKNANEHAPEESLIELKAEQLPLCTIVSVSNSGPAIAAEDLGHLFERFHRGHHAARDSVGIGLEITRSLISQLGGRIEVESSEGQPTVFRMIFPR